MRTFKKEGDWIFEFETRREYFNYVVGGCIGRVLGIILWIAVFYILSFFC